MPNPQDPEHIKQVRTILQAVAGLQDDEHGADSPKRFLDMLAEMTQCSPDNSTEEHLRTCIKWKDFKQPSDELITLTGITFNSLCNHHLVPFAGVVHISYVPRETCAGLSKFARVVQHFARQLQVQERMTSQIADYLERALTPRGVGVVVEAEHMCMSFRGVRAHGVQTTTASMRGVYGDHTRTAKTEFLSTLSRRK